MPFCKSCGKELVVDARFCPACGAPSSHIPTDSVQNKAPSFQTVKRDAGPYGAYRLEDLPEGFVIDDRYEIKAKVGQGGFGAVYQAYDRNMDVDKALKIIPDSVAADKEAMADLQKEARIMISLNNPNIVRVYDFRDSGLIKYIDMEYVEGKPLNELKLDYPDKRMPEDSVKDLGSKIAAGLEFAHEKNIIHKDIKPQNIIVTESGDVKITDFGISESVRTSMSRLSNSSSSGTLVYMSPEQLKGERIGKEADIYSFGATLYELLSGHPPFYQGAVEYQIMNEAAKPIEGVSDDMNAMVLKCLEKDWERRYNVFNDIKVHLDSGEKAKSIMPIKKKVYKNNDEVETVASKDDNKKNNRKALVVVLVILILTAIGITIGYFLFQEQRRQQYRAEYNYLHTFKIENLVGKWESISESRKILFQFFRTGELLIRRDSNNNNVYDDDEYFVKRDVTYSASSKMEGYSGVILNSDGSIYMYGEFSRGDEKEPQYLKLMYIDTNSNRSEWWLRKIE